MRTKDRLRLESAAEVLGFCRRHPGDAPATRDAEQRLANILQQAAAVTDRLQVARNDLDCAARERDRLTSGLKERIDALIRLSATVAAPHGTAELRLRVRLRTAAPGVFIREARRVIDAAGGHRAILLQYGMPPEMLESLDADLALLAAVHTRRTAGVAAATAAAADLGALAGAAMQVVRPGCVASHPIREQRRRATGNGERATGTRAPSSGSSGPGHSCPVLCLDHGLSE
jgi:hypothetical protein